MIEGLLELKDEIERYTTADVKLDATTRTLYSTDASIYQIDPLGVAFPKTPDDLVGIVVHAAKFNIPILPRGAGSSLAGQAVGEALIIDCSRYLDGVLELDIEGNRALVQPGVSLSKLNNAVAHHHLAFGPDPASGDRATFGGMMGNNSTGAHSILYGMTADHILSIDAIMADGSEASFGMVDIGLVESSGDAVSLADKFLRAALDVRQRYAHEIKNTWPQVWRRATGYNLNYLGGWSASQPPQWAGTPYGDMYPPVLPDHMNMAGLLVGSEGTLAVYKQAWINLVDVPQHKVLGIISYASIADACDAAPKLLQLNPSAVELLPRALIERARSVPAYASRLGFVQGSPAALLLVEFSGDDLRLLEQKARQLGDTAFIAKSLEQQAEIWAVRKVGLGLLMSIKGDKKPLPFVEDVAVPIDRLGEFVREFEQIMDSYGTHGDFYAHASAGCLHVRPLVNLKTQLGIDTMRGITREVVALAVKMGGTLSGEHGDGLARSEWLPQQFTTEIMEAFHKIKQAADPENLLNPRNLLNALPMEKNLRYGAGYTANSWQPILNFDSQGGLLGAVEMCNGAGVCRHTNGLMCPTFQATGDEMHATRGRANLLRSMMSNRYPEVEKASAATFEALDLCLECKGCKAECPSAVDMAKLKYEFLNHYYQSHRRPMRDYLFAYIGKFASFARLFASLSNLFMKNRLSRWIAEKTLGLSRRRDFPSFTKRRYKEQILENYEEEIILLIDPFSEYFYPELVDAALKILSAINCKVHFLPITGAGRTFISKGFLRQAKHHAELVLKQIAEVDPQGQMCVLGIEPSDIYTLRDEYLDLFPGDESTQTIANRTYMIDEYLVRNNIIGETRYKRISLDDDGESVLLHGHCYQKAQPPAADGFSIGTEATLELLRGLGLEAELIESACCGMAGAFGYEAEHFQISMAVGEMSVFPAVRKANGRAILAAGVSCRAHIETGAGAKSLHPIEFITSKL